MHQITPTWTRSIQKSHSHASTDRTSSSGPRTPGQPSRGRGPPPGRAARGGAPGPGPRTEGSCSVLAAAWSGSWGGPHLGSLHGWRGGWGLQGRAGQWGAGRGGSSPSTGLITLPVAADTCGDQRCGDGGTDGQTVGTLSLCCPELNLARGQRSSFQPHMIWRDGAQREGPSVAFGSGPTPQVGYGSLASWSEAGRKLAGSLSSGSPAPQAHGAEAGTGARQLSRLSLGVP